MHKAWRIFASIFELLWRSMKSKLLRLLIYFRCCCCPCGMSVPHVHDAFVRKSINRQSTVLPAIHRISLISSFRPLFLPSYLFVRYVAPTDVRQWSEMPSLTSNSKNKLRPDSGLLCIVLMRHHCNKPICNTNWFCNPKKLAADMTDSRRRQLWINKSQWNPQDWGMMKNNVKNSQHQNHFKTLATPVICSLLFPSFIKPLPLSRLHPYINHVLQIK